MNPVGIGVVPAPVEGSSSNRRDELREVAQQFEALFMQNLISQMRKSQLAEGFFGNESGSDAYEGMFEQFMAQKLVGGSPLGIAELLLDQWTAQDTNLGTVQDAIRRVGTVAARRSYEFVTGAARDPGVSRPFGWGTDPIDGSHRIHEGIDLPAKTGTPVLSLRPGKVTRVDSGSGYGLQVVVEHASGLSTRYAHLSRTAVVEGQAIGGGQALGAVGSTGRSTGPHLHFEISRNGEKVDPTAGFGAIRSQVLGRDADPVIDGTPGGK